MFTEKTKHCNFEKTSYNSPELIKSNKRGILLQLQKSVVVRGSVLQSLAWFFKFGSF